MDGRTHAPKGQAHWLSQNPFMHVCDRFWPPSFSGCHGCPEPCCLLTDAPPTSAAVAFRSRDHLGLSCSYNRSFEWPQSHGQLAEVSLDLQCKLQPWVCPGALVEAAIGTGIIMMHGSDEEGVDVETCTLSYLRGILVSTLRNWQISELEQWSLFLVICCVTLRCQSHSIM